MKGKRKLIPRRTAGKRPEREEAKRFAANVSTILLIVGAVVGLVMVANRWGKKEDLRTIRIVGRTVLDSAEIMERGAIPDSLPLQRVNLQEIESRIASHPFISSVSVYRGENGSLVVEIAERVPVAATVVNGYPYYLDSLGKLLPHRFSSAAADLPVVAGILKNDSGGVRRERSDRSGVPSGLLDSSAVAEALGVLAVLRDYNDLLYRQISEIRREKGGEYTFVTTDGGVPVQVGGADQIEGRLPKLELFMRTVLVGEGVERMGSIDLRWKGQIVVRKRGGELDERAGT